MMADHWKSIANRLGAPGVDEPEVETPAEQPAPKAVRPSPAPSNKPPVRDTTPSTATAPKAGGDTASPDSALSPEAPATKPAEFYFDPNQPIPDEALSFKSSRPSLAPHEPAQPREPGRTTSTPSTPLPAARSYSEPSPPSAAEARREAPSMPDRFEPETPPAAPPPKRKSSWESLANMFNIKVDRSKPVEAAPEPKAAETKPIDTRTSSSRPVRPAAEDDQQLSIFADDRPPRSNPALDAMFGDAPQGGTQARSDEWGKPRVIDDLGWDSDDDTPAPMRGGFAESDEPQSDAMSGSSREDSELGDEEEAPRRGRRRRRGRRGGRGDSSGESSAAGASRGPTADRTSATRSSTWGGLDDSLENEEDLSVGDDPWDEPESFEVAQSDARDELGDDSDSDDAADELSADGEVLRRSSRRRRRGRGRSGRDREAGEVTDQRTDERPVARPAERGRSAPARTSSAPRNTDALSKSVGFRSDSDDENFSDSSDRLDAPRSAPSSRRAEPRGEGRSEARDSEERGSRPRRRRRGGSSSSDSVKSADSRRETSSTGRGRTEGRATGRPSDEEGPIEDAFDDISLGPAFDGEEDDIQPGDGLHRSIPTWADSIQSLVEVNMENRKRGDNRGGTPRGRPRGRR
ncbi:MAG: hypothetical protein R3C56_34705 [Pirellulaceae bacterium]